MTEFPLGDIIRNKDANGRIVKWAMELCPFSLEFASRTTIKSQALVDFIVEWTDLSTPASTGTDEYWTMYFNGSLNIDGAGAGFISQHLITPPSTKHAYMVCALRLSLALNISTSMETLLWSSTNSTRTGT